MAYFDDKGFRTYFMSKSKSKDKERIFSDFESIWYDKFGSRNRLTLTSWSAVKELWTAPNKKSLKTQLIGKGYSAQLVDSLFKCMTDWLKATNRG